jgi:ketosteroid isomerase-like protein
MTTRDTIQGYFDSLKQMRGWEAFRSDEMRFISHTNPIKRVTGRGAYLEATKRFYSMIMALEIKGIVVDGEKACALTRYELQPPGGAVFDSHVAEVFEVREGKITSFEIYFDSAPFPK